MFLTVPLSIIRSFSVRSVLILLASCQQTCMTYTIDVCTVKTPDDVQRSCPKHVDFYSKNKINKLVGFIIRIYYDAQSPERQIWNSNFIRKVVVNSILLGYNDLYIEV